MKLSATTAVIAGFVAVAAALPTANVVVRSGGVDNAVIVARDDVVVDAARRSGDTIYGPGEPNDDD
ncbi:hypothetical protein V2A60_007170 [Cordyceps javanica]